VCPPGWDHFIGNAFQVEDCLQRADCVVVEPSASISTMRSHPREGLAEIREIAVHVAGLSKGNGRVLWLLENRNNHGLDDVELEAVLGMWFDIEFLEQVGRGEPVSRLVVGCAIRTEILAVSFLFPRDCEGRLAEWRSLLLMLLSRVPVAILFLSSTRAESLLGPGFGVTRLLLKLVVRRGTAIGLEVPQSRA
jgi:hypothetical protein